MRPTLWLAAFSSVFAFGACVADSPEFAGSDVADAGSSSDGGVNDRGDSGGGTAKTNDGGVDELGGGDGGESDSDLSTSCAAIDGGDSLCSGSEPVCCAVQNPGGGFNSVTLECAASNASCSALTIGVAITCRQRSDCPSGSVCCGRKSSTNNSVFVSVKCETSCDGISSFGQATYCDPGDAHTCDGTGGGTTPFCEPSDFPGMFECENE